MDKFLGVVLSGGESKRMGRDKGLLPIHDTHWAKFIEQKLLALQIPVVVSVNSMQVESYSKLFSAEQLVVDTVAVEGPLKGLLSVHQKYPECDLLLMACDMIEMETSTLNRLVQVYQANPLFDFCVYQQAEFAEPFGGIYTSDGLKNVMKKLACGTLTKFSMRSVLDTGNTKRVVLEHTNRNSFKNYNSLP
ncbi:molybdenum cofactor guanylyltransferase [Pontibacter silvestris]|uniref:Molybdenum cofactor guanylyltransferase n=1 Tax=Pontibacter silvestris TaxID=2305183 RepID=A0ABW4X244_9BACT|nr:NTP transferase domain-containing protein [Pontibacter silvestris]MCC9137481.1 NTP transferase domain-containing protein [Pontibacter silvestris]